MTFSARIQRFQLVILSIVIGVVFGANIALAVVYYQPGKFALKEIMARIGLKKPTPVPKVDWGTFYRTTQSKASANWEGIQSPTHPQWKIRRGFDVMLSAKGFTYPVNIAFVSEPSDDPDAPLYYVNELHGTIKYVTRSGTVRIYATDLNNFKPIHTTKSDEKGVSGLMIVPDSEDLLITGSYVDAESGLLHNHVLRLISEPGGKALKEVQTLLDLKEVTAPSNQIQQILQGKDGKLYVSVGDAENHYLSLDLDKFGGKILRLNFDGSAPEDNPFYDKNSPRSPRSYIYAYGVRNVFDFDVHPVSGQLYATDNGKFIDRLVHLLPGTSYGWNGEDDSMRMNALYTWGPDLNVAPVGLTFLRHDTLGESTAGHLYVGLYGRPAALGKNVAKSILEFVIDPNTGLLKRTPERLLQYIGKARTTVLGLAEGPDGLYFTDFFGETVDTGAEGTGAVWKIIPSKATLELVATADAELEGMTPVERGQVLFFHNCSACHLVEAIGGHEGPELTQVATKLDNFLHSPTYIAAVKNMLKSNEAFLVQQRGRLQEVLDANGEKRLQVWFHHHLEEPRFDNIYAQMPAFNFLTKNHREDIIDFLMTLR